MTDFDDDEEPTSFQRYKLWIALGILVVGGGGFAFWKLSSGGGSAAPRQEHITMVSLPPPPPPKPIPTPPPQPPPEQKVEEKQSIDPDPKPADKPEPPKDEPPPSMGSNIKGDGKDGFGLSGSGNGGRVGFGGNGNGNGSAYRRYAAQMQARIAEALRQDKRTRTAAFDLRVSIWVDESGRVTRVEPAGGGDGSIVAGVVGVRLTEPPPRGMKMPVTAHLSARRPN